VIVYWILDNRQNGDVVKKMALQANRGLEGALKIPLFGYNTLRVAYNFTGAPQVSISMGH